MRRNNDRNHFPRNYRNSRRRYYSSRTRNEVLFSSMNYQSFPSRNTIQNNHYNTPYFVRNHNKKNLKKDHENDNIEDLSLRDKLIRQISSNKCECSICMELIGAHGKIWSCKSCYAITHLNCIKKWCTKSLATSETSQWECLICKNSYSQRPHELTYRCFCDKVDRPVTDRNTLPHSCGNTCSRKHDNCNHECVAVCHPGPCPDCESSHLIDCLCGKTQSIQVRCSINTIDCGKVCGNLLNCGEHYCEQICHSGDCNPCNIVTDKSCYCGKISGLLCGVNLSCETICGQLKTCGNHVCDKICHSGSCDACDRRVDAVTTCNCGKNNLTELKVVRETCLDGIPSCNQVCGRLLVSCGHECARICHENDCGECTLEFSVTCRCEKTQLILPCREFRDSNEKICSKPCDVLLNCRKHQCSQVCCVLSRDSHDFCDLFCGKSFPCKRPDHTCELPCNHKGKCQKCTRVVSWSEVTCYCGMTKLLPPIYCSQYPLELNCSFPCVRIHPCGHPQNHACTVANDLFNGSCPPCTYLTDKMCHGGHKTMRNIECHRQIYGCGEMCGKQLAHCLSKTHRCQKPCHPGGCDDNPTCHQKCSKSRESCGHPCNATCHSGDCANFQTNCEQKCRIQCSCLLTHVYINCHELQSYKDNRDFILQPDTQQLTLKCTVKCEASLKTANKLTLVRSMDIPNHTLKYFRAYLEEFCSNNMKFVESVESIFLKLLETKEPYVFYDVNIDKTRFIRRFGLIFRFKVISCDQNQSDVYNIRLEHQENQSKPTKFLLSTFVRNKYLNNRIKI